MGSPDKNPEKGATMEILKFRWHQEVAQYGDKLLQRLDEFRKKNVFYDVTLKTTDEALAAHKVVLAACGGMFRYQPCGRNFYLFSKTNAQCGLILLLLSPHRMFARLLG